MPRWFKRRILAAPLVLSLVGLAACSSSSAGAAGCSSSSPAASPVVTLAAYSNPYLAYGKLISTWQSEWKDAHDGQLVQFLTSFGGSTTQAQSIINGLQADIYAFVHGARRAARSGCGPHHERLGRTPRTARPCSPGPWSSPFVPGTRSTSRTGTT